MTVSSTDNRWSYTGNGASVAFAYTNRIFAETDLKVYVNGALKTLGSDYTVSGVDGVGGGNVVFVAAPATAAKIAIVRDVPATQALDLAALGSFPAEENEKALDRLTILVQQLVDKQLRTLRQPDSDAAGIGELPSRAARAGHLLAFDEGGEPSPGAVTLPATLTPLDYVRVNPAGSAYELRTPAQARSDLGADNAGNLTGGTLDMARIADGSIAGAMLAPNAVSDRLGYTPLNRAGDTMTGGLNMQAAITLSADPIAAMQAATKQYVDAVAAGLGKRGTVRLATTGNHGLSGLAGIDGVVPAANDLILVRNQTASSENGVYVAAAGAWARAPLFDTWDELAGSLISVQEGSVLADTLWLCASNSGGTLGATGVLWSQIFPGSGGTVTNIATANGVKGGPVVSTGTIELDVNGLSEDTAPDLTADFVPAFDSSVGVHKKVRLQNLGGTTVSQQSGSFIAGTTPNTLYVITDTADAGLPDAATVPDGFRATFKNATDGKSVRVVTPGADLMDGVSAVRVPGRGVVEVMRTAVGTWTILRAPSCAVGQVVEWTTNTLPDGGWAWANGQALSRTTYKGLFDVWGTTYGAGDGSTTFNVRDDRGRVKAGKDDMGGASAANRLTPGGSGIAATTLGATGGAQTHTLSIAEMPSHSHSNGMAMTTIGNTFGGPEGTGPTSSGTGNTGGGNAHQNTQPTIITNFIVKT